MANVAGSFVYTSAAGTILNSGGYTLSATFTPTDTTDYTTQTASVSLTVNPDVTAESVSSSVNPSLYGQPVTFVATVAATESGRLTRWGACSFS